MSTWEERMAARNVENAHRLAIGMDPAERERVRRRDEANARFAAFCISRGASGGVDGGTVLKYDHWHPAHGNATVDARTGEILNVFTVVIDPDAPPRPESCPVCDDFRLEDWPPR